MNSCGSYCLSRISFLRKACFFCISSIPPNNNHKLSLRIAAMRPHSRSRTRPPPRKVSPQLPVLLVIPTVLPTESMLEVEHRAASQPPRGMRIGPWVKYCVRLWGQLEGHEFGFFFRWPVNPERHGLEDYFRVVIRPMDLETIRLKLHANAYRCAEDFDRDIRLMLDNAGKVNAAHQEIMERIGEYSDFYFAQRRQLYELFRNETIYDERRSHLFKRLSHQQKVERFRRRFFTKERLKKLAKKLMKFNRVERYRLWRTMIRKFPELKTIKEKVSLSKFTTQQLVAFLKLCRKLSLLRKYMKKKEKATATCRKMRMKGRGKMANPQRQTLKKRPKKSSRSSRSKPSKGSQSTPKKKSKSSGKSKQSKNSKQSKQSKQSRQSRPSRRPQTPRSSRNKHHTSPARPTRPARVTRPPQPVRPPPRKQDQEESSFEIEDD